MGPSFFLSLAHSSNVLYHETAVTADDSFSFFGKLRSVLDSSQCFNVRQIAAHL